MVASAQTANESAMSKATPRSSEIMDSAPAANGGMCVEGCVQLVRFADQPQDSKPKQLPVP